MDKLMRIAFVTFGCKVNKAETDALINTLASYGGSYAENPSDADAVIINTCAVTEKAQKDGVKFITRLKRKNPRLITVATGCLAELMKDELKADHVVPNADKMNAVKLLLGEVKEHAVFLKTHTRAFLKVQDGCDCHCSYCIIPSLRGKPVSKSMEKVLDEARGMISAGYKEIVVTGIHIGLYGADIPGSPALAGLLKELALLDGDFRLRFSSLYVNEIDVDFIKTVAQEPKICGHFHISLQSGSDSVLTAMGRNYTAADFLDTVELIREYIPDAGLGADVIVGFPGESAEHFNESMRLLDEARLDYLHVFPYSRRPGTKAAAASGQVGESVKLERAKLMRDMAEKHKQLAAEALVGRKFRVLSEKDGKGHTDSFWLVDLPEATGENEFVDVVITGCNKGVLCGKIAGK